MKNYFTMSETAKICSVSRATMNRWVNAGKIDAYTTMGGHKRILPDVLKSWLKANNMPFDIHRFNAGKTKVLIADDDASVRNYIVKLLNIPLFETQTAIDGFEAGKKVVQFEPDLMILDISMPNMDGIEVCRQIKNDPATKHIKTIILTGYGTKINKDRAAAAGADVFLEKPASKTKIMHCIEDLLGGKN